jgi:NAD(P)-dependent dehydrogenase (short-subunit alcohol dehydrogenase family)
MGSLQFATQKDFEFYNFEVRVYDASKAALNMLMLNFSRVLSDSANGRTGKANSVCPGVVATPLSGGRGDTTEVGATRIVELATLDDEDGPTGTFTNRHGALPW